MAGQRAVIRHEVPTAKGLVHVDEYPGDGPAVVMTHGIPDDSRIYDRLIPELAERRLVTFDFLGYGRSARDTTWPLQSGQREGELGSVIEALELDRPVLLGHDIGGPVVIRYALSDPSRVGGMVLLNTFFGDSPTLEFPEFIRLLADPHLAPLADEIVADPNILGWMLLFTGRTLGAGPPDADGVATVSILPQFFGSAEQPAAIAAIRAWTADLLPGVVEQNAQIASGRLAELGFPVRIAFGSLDSYFDDGVAEHMHALFPNAVMRPIPDAAHWPQWDQPAAVAAVIAEVCR